MNYRLIDEGSQALTLRIMLDHNGTGTVEINGDRLDITARRIGPSGIFLIHENRPIDVYILEDRGEIQASYQGRVYRLKLQSRRQRDGSASSAEGKVVSKMPGKVVKVLKSKGDRVVAGEGVVVVEAMKMENEFKSRIAGTVSQINVVAGDSISTNTVLAVITPDGG